MAEIAATQILAHGDTRFPGADMSTKLKLLGVDVASFGDAMAVTDGALEIVSLPIRWPAPTKLVVADDGRTVLGGILVGDADAYATLKPMVGRELPGDPSALIAPAAGTESALSALPDDAEICSCNGVSRAPSARRSPTAPARSPMSRPAARRAPPAAAACRASPGCSPTPASNSRSRCVSTSPSPGPNCSRSSPPPASAASANCSPGSAPALAEICKPTVASILASTSSDHILDGEARGTAGHQRPLPGQPAAQRDVLGGAPDARRRGHPGPTDRDRADRKGFSASTKVTGGQRIDMFGARVEGCRRSGGGWWTLRNGVRHAYGKSLRTVKSCVGSTWCRYGVQDSVGMAVTLEQATAGCAHRTKLKLASPGARANAPEARNKDVGVIATEQGWNLYVGGNGGQGLKHAQLLASGIDDDTLIRYIDRYLMFYIRTLTGYNAPRRGRSPSTAGWKSCEWPSSVGTVLAQQVTWKRPWPGMSRATATEWARSPR